MTSPANLSSSMTMKSLMKSVQKRLTYKPSTDLSNEDGVNFDETLRLKEVPEHWIENSDLPRTRQSRQVSRNVLQSLPALRDIQNVERRREVFLLKCRLCSFRFTFNPNVADSAQDARDKELKRTTLLELVNYLTVQKPRLGEEELSDMFEMLRFNLFRPLPSFVHETMGEIYSPDEDEALTEASWPHLQVVYELLLRVASLGAQEADTAALGKQLDSRFVCQLLNLFQSEDARQRDYLKTIVHHIYGNFMALRPLIRKQLNNVPPSPAALTPRRSSGTSCTAPGGTTAWRSCSSCWAPSSTGSRSRSRTSTSTSCASCSSRSTAPR